MLKVGIIGCGLIGAKRAAVIKNAKLVACADSDKNRLDNFSKQFACERSYQQWQELIEDANIDMVIVATPHHLLAEITHAAILANKHVFIEKPAARNAQELAPLLPLIEKSKSKVRVGFNHRYHRAFQQAHLLISENAIGDLMYIRARYGHGGRKGYDQEWRANPAISGGGELIDQGVHLIDLSRWFLGEFVKIEGFTPTYFWNMPVDDNAFMMLRTAKEQMAFLHASCTEWKNLFSFEIYGKTGKLVIEGLGGSYGIEKLYYYKMLPEMGPPETTIWEYPMADNSWELELTEFMQDIMLDRNPNPGLKDAYAALQVVAQLYSRNSHEPT